MPDCKLFNELVAAVVVVMKNDFVRVIIFMLHHAAATLHLKRGNFVAFL